MYEALKSIHIVSVILFVGTVFFRTFVIFKLKTVFSKEEMQKVKSSLGKQARKIIKINNLVLIISGITLMLLYVNINSFIFHLKVFLGLVLAVGFYFVPILFTKMDANERFTTNFHYMFFSLLISVIVLSQYIYY